MIPLASEWFEPGSGFSWCESAHKYQVVSYIAEFANTVRKRFNRSLALVILRSSGHQFTIDRSAAGKYCVTEKVYSRRQSISRYSSLAYDDQRFGVGLLSRYPEHLR